MGSRVITMYQQQQMYQQQPMQQQQMQQTFRVVYPQGISWRASPNYNHKVTNMQGPLANTMLSGPVVQGQDGLQYLQVGSQFLPLSAPNGQQLLQMQQGNNMMQNQMNNDIHRVQGGYGGGQPGYGQGGAHGCHGKKGGKMKGYKNKCGGKNKGYKIKLF